MDTTTLRDLSRPALQKLAKENHIKANLRSDTIIQLLLERHIQGKVTSHIKSVAGADRTPTRSSIRQFQAANTNLQAPSDNSRKSLDPADPYPYAGNQISVQLNRRHAKGSHYQAEDVFSRAPSAETTNPFATPESSVAGTPEPEADPVLLQRTVEMMADIDRIDKETLDKITKLRIVTAKLRVKAGDLRGLLQAERAMRIRMEDYFAYWTQTSPRWTYEAVWSGQMRVMDMNEGIEISTSDEEGLAAQDMDYFGEAPDMTNQESVIISLRSGRTFVRNEGLSTGLSTGDQLDLEVAYGISPPVEAERLTDIVQNPKRQRDEDPDDDQDESRYSSRPRSGGNLECTGDPAFPLLWKEGKGKTHPKRSKR